MAVAVKDPKTVVRNTVEKHGTTRDELIPILNEVNQEVGYLPDEALKEISTLLHIPQSQILSVASFYEMLSTEPRGRHTIKFCESAPCHVVGGREVWQALQERLNLKNGQTSLDGKWSLVTTSCLGVCAVGPVVIIDEDIYGNVTPDQLNQILSRYS